MIQQFAIHVWDARNQDKLLGYVRRDGSFAPIPCWANDCKFDCVKRADDAKITHVIATARETPGVFPYAYTIEECT